MATKEMCSLCFRVLEEKLINKKFSPVNLSSSFPLFVTWSKWNNFDKIYELRGCIGTFESLNLSKGLEKFALYSAFKDTRFEKITAKELPLLKCTISLLVNFNKISNIYDWTIGKHGIIINFNGTHGNPYSATFLPDVMIEQNWDQKETIVNLVRKSGYTGNFNQNLINKMEITTYESSIETLTYDEYLKM